MIFSSLSFEISIQNYELLYNHLVIINQKVIKITNLIIMCLNYFLNGFLIVDWEKQFFLVIIIWKCIKARLEWNETLTLLNFLNFNFNWLLIVFRVFWAEKLWERIWVFWHRTWVANFVVFQQNAMTFPFEFIISKRDFWLLCS